MLASFLSALRFLITLIRFDEDPVSNSEKAVDGILARDLSIVSPIFVQVEYSISNTKLWKLRIIHIFRKMTQDYQRYKNTGYFGTPSCPIHENTYECLLQPSLPGPHLIAGDNRSMAPRPSFS